MFGGWLSLLGLGHAMMNLATESPQVTAFLNSFLGVRNGFPLQQQFAFMVLCLYAGCRFCFTYFVEHALR